MAVIVDTDLNFPSDDTQALLLLLAGAGRRALHAATAVAGNTFAQEVDANLRAVLAAIGAQDIPVSRPDAPRQGGHGYHQAKTLKSRGGVPFIGAFQKAQAPRIGEPSVDSTDLAGWLDRAETVTDVVCLGPLSNVAPLLTQDHSPPETLGQLWIMGGNVRFDQANPKIDFNTWFDPLAAQSVFASGYAGYVFPYETCRQFRGDSDLAHKVAQTGVSGVGQLFSTDFLGMVRQHGVNLPLCDQLVVLAYLEPSIIKQTRRGRIVVQTSKGDFQGASQFEPDPASQLEIVTEVDADLARRTLLQLCATCNTMGDDAALRAFMSGAIYGLDFDPAGLSFVH